MKLAKFERKEAEHGARFTMSSSPECARGMSCVLLNDDGHAPCGCSEPDPASSPSTVRRPLDKREEPAEWYQHADSDPASEPLDKRVMDAKRAMAEGDDAVVEYLIDRPLPDPASEPEAS